MDGETKMLERVARAIAEADMEDFMEDAERYIIRARHAVVALKDPLPEINAAICKGAPAEHRVAMQLGYERGLDAVLHGA